MSKNSSDLSSVRRRGWFWILSVCLIVNASLSGGANLAWAGLGELRGCSVSDPEEVLTGRYGTRPGEFLPRESGYGHILGVASFCVSECGEVTVIDASGRRLRVYGRDGSCMGDVEVPEGRVAFRVASTEDRIYALCSLERTEEGVRGYGDRTLAQGDEELLALLVYSLDSKCWLMPETVLRTGAPDVSEYPCRSVEQRIVLVTCAGEAYLYDPHPGVGTRLTVNGCGVASGTPAPVSTAGRPLRCGARAVRFGRGISLLWEKGSRRDMPWLAGSLIGGDSAGLLYMCETDYEGDQPKVRVAVYNGGARPVSEWVLPGRPGEVRMLGPRVTVSAGGDVYEYWSSLNEFHIVRWRSVDPYAGAD
jgi:hypothetical protein